MSACLDLHYRLVLPVAPARMGTMSACLDLHDRLVLHPSEDENESILQAFSQLYIYIYIYIYIYMNNKHKQKCGPTPA
jgi:hypothetical protein